MKYIKYLIIVLFLSAMTYGLVSVYTQYANSLISQTNMSAPSSPSPPSKSEPTGGTGPTDQDVKKEPPSTKVEVAGLIKVEMLESNSWSTILKILALILGSAVGVKIINTTFKRFE